MSKKSLFFGAAALALLVLFAFAGCSNPASDDGGGSAAPISRAYPDGTVYTDNLTVLEGLLNDSDADSNNYVTHIVFTGDNTDITRDLRIPNGKVVYLNTNLDDNATAFGTLAANIIVEQGGRLVLESDLTTDDTVPARLLVKGTVDVYSTLSVTTAATEVADYFEAGDTITARNTVIGRNVFVWAGGTLVLDADDIANQTTPDRFTPAEAWAAAGQGNLTVTGALSSVYTVEYLLAGLNLEARDRRYTVATAGGGTLPSRIPPAARITTTALIDSSVDDTLVVEGGLTANNAGFAGIKTLTVNGVFEANAATFAAVTKVTVDGQFIADSAAFESVETLLISTKDTDTLTSRASVPSADPWHEDTPLMQADSATLIKATEITIGDNGEFVSDSVNINLPEQAKIRLGRSALFNAVGVAGNTFDNLESLFIGPASSVTIASNALTFKSLKTLTLQDSASLIADTAGTLVTFFNETPPANPVNKTEITLGKNVLFNVLADPAAKADVKINTDSNLRTGSQIVLSGESTFTLAAGKTLTLETGATLSLLAALANDTGITDPPVKIYGTLVVSTGATVTIPALNVFTTPGDISSVISFGSTGKMQVQNGGAVNAGTTPDLYVGAGAVYVLTAASDAIEFSEHHRKIIGAVSLADDDSIPKNDTLEIAAASTLTIAATKKLTLNAEGQTAGAALIGPGKLIAHKTEIIGGIYGGWQVTSGSGAASIEIAAAAAASSITASVPTVSLVAKGPGAVITQVGGAVNALTITAATAVSTEGVINLGQDGKLVLEGTATTAPGITLPANGMIKIGTGAATANVTNAVLALPNATIGASITGKAAAQGASVLTQIIGAAATNTIVGSTTPGDDVVITANIPATGS
jgi:hypothetical protein